jgi:hypothetical protein
MCTFDFTVAVVVSNKELYLANLRGSYGICHMFKNMQKMYMAGIYGCISNVLRSTE